MIETFYPSEKLLGSYRYWGNESDFTIIFKRNPDYLRDSLHDEVSNRIVQRVDIPDEQIVGLLRQNKLLTVPELSATTGKSAASMCPAPEGDGSQWTVQANGSRKTGCLKIRSTRK